MPFARVYPLYIAKVEKKGRTRSEVDEVILWLTGYDVTGVARVLADQTDFETFFSEAPAMNPLRTLITGSICGYKISSYRGIDRLARDIQWDYAHIVKRRGQFERLK